MLEGSAGGLGVLQSDSLLAERAATSGLDRLGYKQKAEIVAAAALATSNLRSIVFPIIGDAVGGILRPGQDYAIFAFQCLALRGNTGTRSTASRFRVPPCFSGTAANIASTATTNTARNIAAT